MARREAGEAGRLTSLPRPTLQSLALGGAIIAVTLATLGPLAAARYLPLLDQPNHLAAMSILHHHDVARFGFATHYELVHAPVPYWGYYGAVHVLAWLVPLEVANKLFLALALLGLPAGLAALLRACGRPRILCLAALPLGWSYDLELGFIAFVASAGVLLYACALLIARRRLVLQLALGLALYFLHPLTFVVWVVAVVAHTPRRAWLAAPPLALFVAVMPWGAVSARWNTPWENLALLPQHLFGFVAFRWQMALVAALAAAWLAAAALARRAPAPAQPYRLLVVVLALYFLLPEELARPVRWWMVNGRLALLAALIAFVCVAPGKLQGARAALVCAPLVAAAIVYPAVLAFRFAAFDARAADFRAVADALPYDPSVLTLVYPPQTDPAGTVAAWRQFPAYVQVERGGYDPYAWADGFPMRAVTSRPAPPERRPEEFDWNAHARAYEYILTRNEPDGLLAGRPVTLVAQRGAWRLWHRD